MIIEHLLASHLCPKVTHICAEEIVIELGN